VAQDRIMNLIAARAVLFVTGFALWALTSTLPLTDAVHEGWDRPVYWQVGLPVVFAVQVAVAILSKEKIALAPLWVLLGHVIAMLFIARSGTGIGLLPLSVLFVGVPLYLMLLLGAFIGQMVRRLTGLAS
jgi:hypothetical protein